MVGVLVDARCDVIQPLPWRMRQCDAPCHLITMDDDARRIGSHHVLIERLFLCTRHDFGGSSR